MRFSKKAIAYMVSLALLFSWAGDFGKAFNSFSIPFDLLVSKAQRISEDNSQDYVIMPTSNETVKSRVAQVGMSDLTANEWKTKYTNVLLEKDICVDASTETKKVDKEKLYRRLEKEKKENEKKKDTQWTTQAINADGITGTTKEKIKVALLDSGVDMIDGINLAGSINLVDSEESISPMFCDLTGHGTAIASIISGNGENAIHGINPNVDLYSVKVLDKDNKAPISRIIEGIYWCIDNDINIINMSFGMCTYSKALEKAIKDAYKANILMIAASGNGGTSVEYPAAYDEVMAVAATDTDCDITEFSNVGKELEVAAPGINVEASGYFDSKVVACGTSFSVPFVVGTASLLWEKNTSKTNKFIRGLINYSEKVIDNESTCGLLDAKYAIEVYDKFEAQYNNNEELCATSINESSLESFDNVKDQYVEGRWENGGHTSIIEYGLESSNINNDEKQKLLKMGVLYPDIRGTGLENSESSFPELHGGWYRNAAGKTISINYISCYELITTLARDGGGRKYTSSYGSIMGINSATYNRLINVISSSKLGNKTWNEILSSYGCANTLENRKYFLWGCAMHLLGDIFAHSTLYYNKTNKKWEDLSHALGADIITVYPNRFLVAKKAVKYSLKMLEEDTIGDYYEIYQALRYGPYNDSWKKKKLLDYAKGNAGQFMTDDRLTYFKNASK